MLRTKVVKGMLGVSAVAALFAALAVHAQSTGTQSDPQGSSGQTTGQSGTQAGQAGTQAETPAGQTGTATGTPTGTALTRADRKALLDMAMANMAEIESARTAQTRSQNEQVKNYAQQMIDDHTKALNEVKDVAQAKGVTLPTELDRMRRAKADRLAAMSGDAFDRAYMAQAGVADHKKVHSQLRQVQSRVKDPEIKALAARTLPIVDQHLNSAQQLHKNTARGSSKTQGTTQSSQDRQQPQQQEQPQPQQ